MEGVGYLILPPLAGIPESELQSLDGHSIRQRGLCIFAFDSKVDRSLVCYVEYCSKEEQAQGLRGINSTFRVSCDVEKAGLLAATIKALIQGNIEQKQISVQFPHHSPAVSHPCRRNVQNTHLE